MSKYQISSIKYPNIKYPAQNIPNIKHKIYENFQILNILNKGSQISRFLNIKYLEENIPNIKHPTSSYCFFRFTAVSDCGPVAASFQNIKYPRPATIPTDWVNAFYWCVLYSSLTLGDSTLLSIYKYISFL